MHISGILYKNYLKRAVSHLQNVWTEHIKVFLSVAVFVKHFTFLWNYMFCIFSGFGYICLETHDTVYKLFLKDYIMIYHVAMIFVLSTYLFWNVFKNTLQASNKQTKKFIAKFTVFPKQVGF